MANENKTLKILVCGSCLGQYSKLFKRVSDVNQKAGPFDLLLCVGDFFGKNSEAYDDLINGSTELPNIPCYILGPIPKEFLKYHPNVENFDQGCELTDGITFLGRAGVLTTSFGLKIAYLNGRYRPKNNDNDENLEYFTDKEYESLIMQCQSSPKPIVDILLTTEWPENIFNYVPNIDETIRNKVEQSNCSSLKISQLCNTIRPRYHFVGGQLNLFFERVPYRNHNVLNESTRNVTRFISMADVGNLDKKQKWIYAFNIISGSKISSKELNAQPNGTTENPFKISLQAKLEQDDQKQSQSDQFRYDLSRMNNHHDSSDRRQQHGGNNKRKFDNQKQQKDSRPRKELKVDLENCWFCLASPNVDKSLIVSIGNHSYLALAKGGLTDDHMMILPIEHIRSTIEIQNNDLREEIEKFKNALTGYYQQQKMIPIFFERNFKCPHFQIQVIGLPMDRLDSLKDAVKEIFKDFEINEMNIDDELEDICKPGIPYFYFECYNHYKFFIRINIKEKFFPIQIGRELMAHKLLLNCPERINWKYCLKNNETDIEQIELTENIRKKFQPFDFTI